MCWEFVAACAFRRACRRIPWRDGVLDCRGAVGRGSGVCGGVFRFENELFGAAYHLHDKCHIFNIFGVTACGE